MACGWTHDGPGGRNMARYAAQTEVASDRSRAEIERTLKRYGATRA